MTTLTQTATFTRPADTTAYTAGDLVANTTTAGEVVALEFGGSPSQEVLRTIRAARVRRSGTGSNGVSFALFIYSAAPTPTNGDNGAFLTTGRATLLSKFVGTAGDAFADGKTTQMAPSPNAQIPPIIAGKVYGLLQVNDAMAPASGETFTVQLFCTTYAGR